MMKKILIFSLAYYPRHVSGAEAAIREITDRIRDIEFHLITLRFDKADMPEEKIGNVMVYRAGGSGSYISKTLFPLTAALKARALHRKHSFSFVWAMMTYMLLPVAVLRLLGVRIPHILTLQDGDPYEKVFQRIRVFPFLPFLNWGFRSARVIQVISTYLATWPPLRGYKGEIVMIHNGANPKDLKESFDPADVEKIKKQFGKKPNDLWLVNTARLVHQKGNDVTIRALPLLPEHVKLLLVGGGEDENMLKKLVTDLRLENRVFFSGYVDRTQVTNYRKSGDIFVCPSRSEGLGNAFLSAMASRLPVIATQEGGLSDFLFDEKRNPDRSPTGWAVSKDNPDEIARAVQDILAHPDKVKRTLDTARTMVEEKYDWDNIAQDMRRRVFEKAL